MGNGPSSAAVSVPTVTHDALPQAKAELSKSRPSRLSASSAHDDTMVSEGRYTQVAG